MTYLYCFSRSSEEGEPPRVVESQRGIDGTAIRRLTFPGMAASDGGRCVAWVGSMEQVPSLTAAHVAEHDHVCGTVLAAGDDVLPVRFGQVFESDAALTADYEHRAEALRPVWRQIANGVEMSVMLVATDHASETPAVAPAERRAEETARTTASSTGIGYAYLSALAGPIRERRRLRELIEPFRMELRRAAGALIRREAVRSQDSPSATVLSHLVPRSALSDYRGVLAGVEIAHPLIRVLLLGPHAPYSFVSLEPGTPAAGAHGHDGP